MKATPHTRGSTVNEDPYSEENEGYPAHAGIDPNRNGSARIQRRLPRTRGDRPISFAIAVDETKATPHTRGSTQVFDLCDSALEGYPAHAGIDPVVYADTSRWTWLPRTRGDRPYEFILLDDWKEATPHTRGSTVFPSILRPGTDGYPAHAGIDLESSYHVMNGYGLPRTRGDRPE